MVACMHVILKKFDFFEKHDIIISGMKNTYKYSYRILRGKYSKVERELNKLETAHPTAVKIVHIDDHYGYGEMLMVIRTMIELKP